MSSSRSPPPSAHQTHNHAHKGEVMEIELDDLDATNAKHISQPVKAAAPAKRSLGMEFALGGVATVCACVFTNPIEVVKTRMQVQGELQVLKNTKQKGPYKNPFHAFFTIAKQEGLKGLQGGFGSAALYQLTMNGTRLGLYAPLKQLYTPLFAPHTAGDEHSQVHGPPNMITNVLAGASSGVAAAIVGSPFFLMKVRLQVQYKHQAQSAITTPAPPSHTPTHSSSGSLPHSQNPAASVGVQHGYQSTWSGLRSIWANEGISGLYRGVHAAMLRVGIGSAVQLSSYDACKHAVLSTTGLSDGVPAHFAASLISGFFVTVAMNPPDVISTRLYNQQVKDGKGVMYSSLWDCYRKTVQTEGIGALYKGFLAHYLRLGPHTILTFVFWEQAKKLADQAGL